MGRVRWMSTLLFCACALLFGCGTHKAVTNEVPVVVREIAHDTLTVTKWRTDSVILRDSVVVSEKGVDRWHTRYVMKQHTDTIYRVRTDSVPQVVTVTNTVTKEVPRKAHWWQTMLEWLGGITLIAIIAIVGIKFAKLRFKV